MTDHTRRDFLTKIGATYGIAGLAFFAANTGLITGAEAKVRGQDHLPIDTGQGRKVAVLGAGVSGLRAAWELAAGGFDVTVIEAAPYMGGRSQTIRPSSPKYKDVWLNLPNQHNFPESAYNDSLYQVPPGSPDSAAQKFTCEFQDDAWEAGEVGGVPDEIYLNAGPGRIPSFHNAVLDHCRKFDVVLEPFIFTTRQNLLQKDDFNGGEPTKLGVIKHSLRLEIEKILNEFDPTSLSEKISENDVAAYKAMVAAFGGADAQRLGFVDGNIPGGWFNNGQLNPAFDLPDILNGEAWKPGLFNDMYVYWQTSLMQPTGGMDRIWSNTLTTELPQGGTIEPLVQIDAPVTRITRVDDGIMIVWGKSGSSQTETFEFCVSTMGPARLAPVVEGFGEGFASHLAQVPTNSACKVGWQSKGRWFEDDYKIYGGISWIDDTRSSDDTLISQVWYPSQDFHSRNATLTGAYNYGEAAEWFEALPHEERLERAAGGGAKLHGVSESTFKKEMVHFDRGLSVAWAHAPYQDGGWTDHKFEHRDLKAEGTNIPLWHLLVDQGSAPLYLAGDYFSHIPGWQEGSLRTALAAVYAIAEKCNPGANYNDGIGGNCRYERLFDSAL